MPLVTRRLSVPGSTMAGVSPALEHSPHLSGDSAGALCGWSCSSSRGCSGSAGEDWGAASRPPADWRLSDCGQSLQSRQLGEGEGVGSDALRHPELSTPWSHHSQQPSGSPQAAHAAGSDPRPSRGSRSPSDQAPFLAFATPGPSPQKPLLPQVQLLRGQT